MTVELNEEIDLLLYVIDFYCDRLCKREDLLEFLSTVCLSHKGLSEDEILHITKISATDMSRLLKVFGEFLMCYRGYWVCSNDIFRKAINTIYLQKIEKKNEIHKKIAYGLEKSPNCVRKLEEQTYQFYCCREDFMLKKIIATVENFLMLFNPMTKFDLFRYWQLLEQGGYDPVVEYNKGIELFDGHYNPESDKLFVIILQVCRFLKEFSDFETNVTPVFRHPKIIGKIGVVRKKLTEKEKHIQLHKYEEAKKTADETAINTSIANNSMERSPEPVEKPKIKNKGVKKVVSKKAQSMTYKDQATYMRRKNDPLGLQEPFYNEDNEISDVDEKKKRSKDTETQKVGNTFNFLNVIGLLEELKLFKLTASEDLLEKRSKDHEKQQLTAAQKLRYDQKIEKKRRFDDILEEWEDVNIDIPESKESFRDHFVKIIAEKYAYKTKQKERDEDEQAPHHHKGRRTTLDSDEEARPHERTKSTEEALAEHVELRHDYQLRIDEIDLEIKKEKDPSYYYYKRWIWIIFPWACLSIKTELNFSEVIARCYSSATKYMRIDEEKEFYKNALQIAIEYRMKKKEIYSSKNPENMTADEVAAVLTKEEEEARQERLRKLRFSYQRNLKPDEILTFSNKVFKIDQYETEKDKLRPANSPKRYKKLPALGSSSMAITRSQATIKPNLKGLNPRSNLFLTNADGSTISIENISKPL